MRILWACCCLGTLWTSGLSSTSASHALGQEPSAFTVFDSGSEWLKLQGEMHMQM